MSDTGGKEKRGGESERGKRTSVNGDEGISDIEGKATRVGASERGQRMSFNGAEGISDIEGKATRVGASERGQRTSFKTAVLFGAAVMWCVPCLAKAESADERLRAIYTEE